MSAFYEGSNVRKSDRERELWVINDEMWYKAMMRSPLNKREYIKRHRDDIDQYIERVLTQKPR